MEAEKLLEALRGDAYARLKHAVLKEEGLGPFSLRGRLAGRREILRAACHIILDREAGPPAGEGSGFSMERFLQLKEEENGQL